MLLEHRLAQTVDAIECDGDVVPEDLRSDDRFHLHAGDAVTFEFRRRYHVSVYRAVHHHLFARHGYSRAMAFWQSLVDHTDCLIFLESGQLAEGSRWRWQRALRGYYSSDEDCFADLLFTIARRLKSVRVIGHHWTHGVRRWLFRIELLPVEKGSVPVGAGPSVHVERTYRRTLGSKSQKLIPASGGAPVSGVHEGVSFRIGTTPEGRTAFCKKYVAVHKARQEFAIARQIDDGRFVSPLGHTAENGLILPFIDLPTLASTEPASVRDKERLGEELMNLFEFARRKDIVVE